MADKSGFSRVADASPDEQQMAQIREILFGAQSRQTAQQISRLEARLGEQDHDLRRLLEERTAGLSASLDALRADLGSQSEGQQSALDAVETTLRTLVQGLEHRLSLVDSDLQDSSQRLERSIAQQVDALDQLQQSGIGRLQLADLLETLARQLRSPTAK